MIKTVTYSLRPDSHFGLSVAAGLVPGVSSQNYSHSKTVLPALTEVVLASGADHTLATYPFLPNTGGDITLTAGDIADVAAQIAVIGLAVDGTEKTEIVTLTGTTPVTVSGFRRVNYTVTTGPEPHISTVTVRRASDNAVMFTQAATAQRSFPGVITMAAGKRGAILKLINSMQKDGGSNTAVVLRIYTRDVDTDVFVLAFATSLQRDGNGSPEFENPTPEFLSPLTDMVITAESESAGSSVFLRASWAFLDILAYPE